VRIPALRDRREDLPLFIDHFLERCAAELGRTVPALEPEARRLLLAYEYPGNIRELANVIERSVTLADGKEVDVASLPPNMRGYPASAGATEAVRELPPEGLDLQAHLDAIERAILEEALRRTSGVKTEAARLLRLTFRSLRYRLAKFGIENV